MLSVYRVQETDSNTTQKKETGKHSSEQTRTIKVQAMTLEELLLKYGIDKLEILKLNCEGAEEQILLGLKRPMARQISVEFHPHLGFRGFTQEICDHMSKWYNWVSLKQKEEPPYNLVFYLKDDWKLYIITVFSMSKFF